MTFEFRKVPAFRSILDRPILKGKIKYLARLNYPLLFFLIAGCSTLAFDSTHKSTNYVRPKTADWAPEPHFYGDLGLPNNASSAMANGPPNGPIFLDGKSRPQRNDYVKELSNSFELDHHLDNDRVRREIAWLQRNPNYFITLQPRLARYLPYICEKVRSRNLPGELCLIPIIESSLDPFAFSSGGAAGFWQFIPSTAKRYGLKIDWWVDERRDLIASTNAALDYLVYLNGRFENWLLAIASYNWGEGRVARARNRLSGDEGFFQMRVPEETATYVNRLLALSAVFAAPDAYDIQLIINRGEIDTQAMATVDTIDQLDLSTAAHTAGISVRTLYRLNPALNQWSTHPKGPHRLMVPASDQEAIQTALSSIPPKHRVAWIRHKIVRNDTLGDLALRYGTDVATLRKANRIVGNRIIEGNYLVIPRSTMSLGSYPTPNQYRNSNAAIHIVRAGDSLWTIAKRYRVTVNTLMRTNRIGPTEIIRPGRKVIIPQQTSRDPVVREIRYKVKNGDSLATIAQKFNSTVTAIANWNTLNPEKYIHPGQELTIYINVTSARSG